MPPNWGALTQGRGSRYNHRERSTDAIEKDTERARASRRRTLLTGAFLAPLGALVAAVVVLTYGPPLALTLDGFLEYTSTLGAPMPYVFEAAVIVLAIGVVNLGAAAILTVRVAMNDLALAGRRLREAGGR